MKTSGYKVSPGNVMYSMTIVNTTLHIQKLLRVNLKGIFFLVMKTIVTEVN